jgi:hypothetical protein
MQTQGIIIINLLFAGGSRGFIAYFCENRSPTILLVRLEDMTQTIYLGVGQVNQSRSSSEIGWRLTTSIVHTIVLTPHLV